MLNLLQKHAPTISIFLLLALIVALFISPPSARLLSIVIIVFGIGTAILFTIHANWQKHKENELTRPEFLRNSSIDLLGLALVMGAAVWFGTSTALSINSLTGFYVGGVWGNTSTWLSASLAGIIVAMVVGAAVAFVVGKVWGKVAEPMKAAQT